MLLTSETQLIADFGGAPGIMNDEILVDAIFGIGLEHTHISATAVWLDDRRLALTFDEPLPREVLESVVIDGVLFQLHSQQRNRDSIVVTVERPQRRSRNL